MSQLIHLTADGIRWQVLPECREHLLGPEGLRLDEWLRAGQARVVKHGPHRTVYHVRLAELSFYLKHYRLADARAWLRELVRPSKARMEFERALAVATRRVPTVTPLALGEQQNGLGPSDSFLITCSLEGTEPLNAFIESTLPALERRRQARLRQRLAVELAKFIARMHDAGIFHNDLHPGNLLIRIGADDWPCLYLIDLHAVQLGPSLSWRTSRANLVMLNRWFVLRVGRTDRLRFWKAYGLARNGMVEFSREPEASDLARDLERRTWVSNLRFWRNRDRRCLATNRYYQRIRSAAASGYAVRDLDCPLLDTLLADPDAPFRRADVILLKDSPSSTVIELDLPVNGVLRRVIYKRFRVTAWSDPWIAWVRRSPALRSWIYGHGLRERGLPTARPLAVLHRRRRGLFYEGYLLTEKIADAVDLHHFLANLNTLPPAELRAALRYRIDQLARLVRELHRCQLSHRDLKATNVLVTGTTDQFPVIPGSQFPIPDPRSLIPAIWLIDLVGVVRYRRLTRKRRVQNLARLNASFHQSAALTRTDKLRFLRVYLQWGLFGRNGWKRWWRSVEQATQLKVARNARTGRPLA